MPVDDCAVDNRDSRLGIHSGWKNPVGSIHNLIDILGRKGQKANTGHEHAFLEQRPGQRSYLSGAAPAGHHGRAEVAEFSPAGLLCSLAFALALTAIGAEADAWKPDVDLTFLSLKIEASVDRPGLGDHATLSANSGSANSCPSGAMPANLSPGVSMGIVFLQPPALGSRPNVFSMQRGIGGTNVTGERRAPLRSGFARGRPYEAP
ncbi:hypothetical protein [Palleronia sp. LCG004]|uniref:hypothetical protein n=1 Tax=Palleronia sp. LCG004 TaxID=3079304 RepID=UPI0029433988|nr:hypothetical protein [Palleronia sp. LCG004]WOI57911.1 hypothetical protein RVY76_14995 [Palleronia sp. LCG004]